MDDKLKANRQLAIGNWQFWLLIAYCILPTAYCFSQHYTRVDTIPVKVNGNFLKMPWVGGHNYVQLSDIDMNFDGIKDLFVFDRTGHKITTYINKGTPNAVDYVDATSTYAAKFPHLEDWALIRDYNCDGLPDIFTYAINCGGIKVWRNTSTGGNLQFTLQTHLFNSCSCLTSQYNASGPLSNLYVSRVDIPTIDDIDNDGDLDVITMDFSGSVLEYHINKSKELGYGCDSLIFDLDQSGCWGHVNEDLMNCNVYLNNCRMMNPDTSRHLHPFLSPAREDENPFPKEDGNGITDRQDPSAPSAHHSGNCSVCLDIDGDNDKDLLIGQITCCNMILLTNGGTSSSAHFTAKDTLFPSNNIQASLSLFPCGYFLDLNNDNKRDLVVCPNAPNISIDNDNIWYYKNTGTNSIPVFERQTKSLFEQDMIDVGEGADPVFFDFNSDGLTDLLISSYAMIHDSCPDSYRYGVWAFQNIGTASAPKFSLVDTNYANLSVQLPNLPSKHLTFGDVDGDGDTDMFVGDYNGFISYFKNTAGAGNPANFVLTTQNIPDNTGTPIDVGSYATPQLIDMDRDGDLDLIIGERTGNLNYYQNTGTKFVPVFDSASSSIKFGGVNVLKNGFTGYSVPFMYDSAGSYRLIVGSVSDKSFPATGWLWYYKNIDGNLSGNFTLLDSMYQNIWEGSRMIVNGKDINNDGRMDLVIGNYSGGVALYMGDSLTTGVSEVTVASFDFSIYPNPSAGKFTIQMADGRWQMADVKIEIYNMIGEKIYQSANQVIHQSTNIDLSPHPQGIYSCVIKSGKTSRTKKLVVLK